MYCSSCGEEIDDSAQYCPTCGHEIGSTPPVDDEGSFSSLESKATNKTAKSDGVDYDIAMSIEDAISRRSIARWILDIVALFVSVGFWAGFLAVEFLVHHRNLNKGKTEPWEEGDGKEFWVHWD